MDIYWSACNWVEFIFAQTSHDGSHQLLMGTDRPLQGQNRPGNKDNLPYLDI